LKTSYYYIDAGEIPREVTLAHLSDIHEKPKEKILEAVKREKPDLIVITGDLGDGDNCASEKCLRFLSCLAGTGPTFYSLGNHEIGICEGSRKLIEETGTVLLDDDFVTFMGIRVGGLTSGFFHAKIGNGRKNPHLFGSPVPNAEFLDRFSKLDGYKILLSHHPEYYTDHIKDRNVQLTLSGHAHGGQIRLFGRGIIAPGQGFFPKLTSGIHDGRLIVSRGLANTAPLIPRLFNETELVIVKLGGRRNS